MTVYEFMKNNHLTVYVEISPKENNIKVQTDMNIEENELFKDILKYNTAKKIEEYLNGQKLPQLWSRGNSKCAFFKLSNKIVCIFYTSYESVKKNYETIDNFEKQLEKLEIIDPDFIFDA